jgi:hypothetical protein
MSTTSPSSPRTVWDRNMAAAAEAEGEDNSVIDGEPTRFKKVLDAAGMSTVFDARYGGND